MIMEPLMATAAEATDMVRGGPQRPCTGDRSKAAGSRSRSAAPQRASVAWIPHVTAASAGVELVEPRTERSGESATPEESEEVGDVFDMIRCGRKRMILLRSAGSGADDLAWRSSWVRSSGTSSGPSSAVSGVGRV